jgi:sugar transferase EpsL
VTGSYSGKRAVDFAVLAVAAVPAALLWLVCAVAILLDDGRPVLFRQERVGRSGESFDIAKFRTMTASEASHSLIPDPGVITRAGRVLRRLSLDELPQLLNVAKGEMSIVGPRPTLRYQVDRYDDKQRGRLAVLPGMTGLAQVRGRNSIDWASRISVDLEYVARQSLWLDVQIMLASIPAVASGTGVAGHLADDALARPEAGEL